MNFLTQPFSVCYILTPTLKFHLLIPSKKTCCFCIKILLLIFLGNSPSNFESCELIELSNAVAFACTTLISFILRNLPLQAEAFIIIFSFSVYHQKEKHIILTFLVFFSFVLNVMYVLCLETKIIC